MPFRLTFFSSSLSGSWELPVGPPHPSRPSGTYSFCPLDGLASNPLVLRTPSGHLETFANLLSHPCFPGACGHHPGTSGFIALVSHAGKLCLGQQLCGTGSLSYSHGLGDQGQPPA